MTTIRKATNDDADNLARLLVELDYFSALKGLSVEDALPRVRQNLAACHADNSHSVHVAEQDDALIGYVSVHWMPCLYMTGPEGFISELFVADSARGQGIGAQLLDTVIAEAKERGAARLELINIKERESYLRGFYAKQGWIERDGAADFVYRVQ